MTPNEIKIEIYKRRLADGLTITQIANSLGVSKQAVSIVIERRQTSRRIAQAVADAIGRPLHEVFPELCNTSGRKSACNWA